MNQHSNKIKKKKLKPETKQENKNPSHKYGLEVRLCADSLIIFEDGCFIVLFTPIGCEYG